jgi:hypothetical protein
MAWLYVPGLEDLNSELNESSLTSETWLSWRGKPSPLPTWSKRWKRVPWLPRLSGLTCEPSRADDFAAKWISSLPDSHANLSHTLADFKEQKIAATFGPMFQGSSAKLDLQSLCWKTSQVSLVSQERVSLQTWPKWGLIVRGELYELQKPELLTKELDSSRFVWPTVTQDSTSNRKTKYAQGGTPLSLMVHQWPTPTTNDHKQAPYQIADGKRYPTLNGAVKNWPTPTAQDAGKATKKLRSEHQNNLTAIVHSFPTPTARDSKGGYTSESLTRKDGKSRAFDSLPNAAIDGLGTDQRPGHLNPEWVEWLMGWPIGWTESGPVETESSLNKPN